MNLLSTLDRWRAGALDWASFGAVNLLQLRHRLPPGYADRFRDYCQHWSTRSLEEYYAIPAGFVWPDLPENGPLRFPSPLPCAFPENNTAVFDLYPCAAGWTAPTMILGHGLMSVSDVGYRMWARRLNALGWNTVFMHLPYHYDRRPRGQWTGESAVCADLIRTAEGVRQAVVECRILIELLARRGGNLFGAWGTSYGGWVSAMLACTEPRLQRLMLVEPIINIESAVWESAASLGLRRVLRQANVRKEDADLHLRLCCPTLCRPFLPTNKIILIAGTYDFIASPEQIGELHRQWEGSAFAAFPQGHVGYTLMPESLRMARKLWADDFLN